MDVMIRRHGGSDLRDVELLAVTVATPVTNQRIRVLCYPKMSR